MELIALTHLKGKVPIVVDTVDYHIAYDTGALSSKEHNFYFPLPSTPKRISRDWGLNNQLPVLRHPTPSRIITASSLWI